MDVYTYGGLHVIKRVFDWNAVIFKSKDFNEHLIYIAIGVGFAIAIWKTVSAFSFGPMIKQFLIPVFLMFSLFTVGGKTVTIHDELTKEKTTVDNVPLLLAATSSCMSSLSRGLTKLFEDHMHDADDPIYNWTGRIYAGQTFLDKDLPKIVDGETMHNFQRFCHNCVRNDLSLGLYSFEELENHPNILDFLMERSSNIRTSGYRITEGDLNAINAMEKETKASKSPLGNHKIYDGEKPLVGEVRQITCSSIARILSKRTEDKIRAAKTFIQNSFVGDREKLLRLNGPGNTPALGNLFQQRLSIDTVKNHTYGSATAFGAAKGELQQVEAQKISGIISMKWIVALRTYLEAFLYTIFPLIILLNFFFLGLKAIQGWIFLLGWISLWPVCYVCANALLTAQFDHRAGVMGLLGKGYTLFTSEGLFQLNQQMEGLAFGVFASIPIMTLSILLLAQKGSAVALAHWAGGLGGFAQGAAAQAAGEAVSGNYSFDNVSTGNQQFNNRSQNQHHLGGFYHSNELSYQDAYGKTTTDDIGGNSILKQSHSTLRAGVNFQDTLHSSIAENQRDSASLLTNSTENFSSDLSNTINATTGLNTYASTNHSQNASADGSLSSQTNALIQEAQNFNKDFSNTQGISEQRALEESIGSSLGTKILGTGLSGSEYLKNSYGSLTGDQKGERVGQALTVNDAYTEASNFVLTNREALSKEEGGREYIDWAEQWTQSQRSSSSLQNAYSETQSWDKVFNETKSWGSTTNQDLSTDFDQWLLAKTGDRGSQLEVLNNPKDLQSHLSTYSKEKVLSMKNDLGIHLDKKAITEPGRVLQSRMQEKLPQAEVFQTEASQRVPSTKPDSFGLKVPTGNEEVFTSSPKNTSNNPIDQKEVERLKELRDGHTQDFAQEKERFEGLQDMSMLEVAKEKTIVGKIFKEDRGFFQMIKDHGKKVQDEIGKAHPTLARSWTKNQSVKPDYPKDQGN